MNEIAEDVWRLESGVREMHLIVLGGVHGNERTGVEVVRRLKERFDTDPGELARGTMTLGIGNPRAVARGTRGSDEHLDLNRSFTEAAMADPSVYEHRRARELAKIIDEADGLIDLHGTNKPSDPFLAMTRLGAPQTVLSSCFDCDKLLLVSPTAINGTTDGWMNRTDGKAGILFESGWVQDPMRIDECLTYVERAMSMLNMLRDPVRFTPPMLAPRRDVHVLRDPVILTDEGFSFEPGRGERSWEPMAKGDVIGRTDTGNEIRAPYDGVLMFPKVPELWKIGNPVVTFACRLEDLDPNDVP